MIAEGIACFLSRKFSFQVVKISVEDHNPPRLPQIVHFIEKAASFTEVIELCKKFLLFSTPTNLESVMVYYFTDILRKCCLAYQPSWPPNRTYFQLQSGSKTDSLEII